MKHLFSIILTILLLAGLAACTSKPVEQEENDEPLILPDEGGELPVSSFREIWGYVIAGREASLKKGFPLSDIGYFGAEIDSYGKLVGVPDRKKISFPARVHLVVGCNGRPLTHFALLPGSKEREALIADLLAAAKNFDGLQIDFEYVLPRDGEAYITFLKELRAGLPQGKMFTVALRAYTRKIADAVYDYEIVAPIVDRILVMAYDEHWSTSKPGPIASLKWCRNVAEYSMKVIGRDKLIMGLPFYGRAWANHNPARALVYSTTEELIRDKEIEISREEGIPFFNYDVSVTATAYYEDAYSLSTRMEMYKSMNVAAIGFWRIGQETQDVWKILKLEPEQ